MPKTATARLRSTFKDSAQAIRALRDAADVTQSELAERLGVAQQVVSSLEQPGHKASWRTISKAAAVLGFEAEITFRRK